MKVVTFEDINNVMGVNIQSHFGFQSERMAAHWVERQENVIFNHIATYAFYGMQRVQQYLAIPQYKETIKQAIIEQISYVIYNGLDTTREMGISAQGGSVSVADHKALKERAIAPLAHDILLNAGLLYAGM